MPKNLTIYDSGKTVLWSTQKLVESNRPPTTRVRRAVTPQRPWPVFPKTGWSLPPRCWPQGCLQCGSGAPTPRPLSRVLDPTAGSRRIRGPGRHRSLALG